MNPQKTPSKKPQLHFGDLLITFLVPVIVGKICVLFFGTNYAAHPGQGYGVGLSLSIIFTLANFGRFIWKYRHYEEDETRP